MLLLVDDDDDDDDNDDGSAVQQAGPDALMPGHLNHLNHSPSHLGLR